MLAYLDALLAALAARDTLEIDRLLAHPLARILGDCAAGDVPEPADRADRRNRTTRAPAWSDRRAAARPQMELPLSA
jgi:hypothetical protein